MDKNLCHSMGLERRKLNLINWISSLKDDSLLKRIESIRNEEDNWWEQISKEERAEIELGLSQLDNGEYILVLVQYSQHKHNNCGSLLTPCQTNPTIQKPTPNC